MTKNCPDCIYRPMLLFDAQGQNETYGAHASIRDNPYVVDRIDWGRWPWADAPPPNTWACPRCGHHESVGPDVEAQLEFRPRLF